MKKQNTGQKHSHLRTWIILVLLVAAAVAIAAYFINKRNSSSTATQYETVKVEKGTLTATIGATGTVRSNQTAILAWQTTGTLGEILVQPGDQVQAGDVLATLSKTSLPQNVILAQADLVAAQRNLDSLKTSETQKMQAELSLVNAQKALDSAKANWDGLRSKNQGGTAGDIENARAQVVIAQNNLKSAETYFGYFQYLGKDDPNYARAYTSLYNAQQALKTAQNNLNFFLLVPSGRDIASAQAKFDLANAQLADAQREWDRLRNGPDAGDLASAQARLDSAQATLNLARIVTPFAGTITEIYGMAGDQVSPGTKAFRVDDLSHIQVDVQVSEVDINSVQVGQAVILTFDAIPGKVYEGKVVEVAQAGDSVQGAVNFTVTVELTTPDAKVKPGMTAAVTITVKQVNNVLLVPNRAVRLVDNQRVVYVLRNGQAQAVDITLGASSDTQSEVVSANLKSGDLIILNPPSTLFTQPSGGGGGPFGGGF
jgi:HlyD family secretion protein